MVKSENSSATPLVGTWPETTVSTCAEKYRAVITFSTGTYRGARGAGQGMIWWDAGIYRLEGRNALLLSVATDELVTYQIDFADDRIEVTDPDGCRFAYRRLSPTP